MKDKKYFIIVFIFALISLFYFLQSYYKTIIDTYVFLCIFSLLPFFNDALVFQTQKYQKYFEKFENYKNYLEFHRYNILLLVINLGILNFFHIKSWYKIFNIFFIIFATLIFIEFYQNRNIYLEKIANFFTKIAVNDDKVFEKRKNTLLFFISGLLFVIGAILFLETFVQKCYFINDDNFPQFLPVLLSSLEQFFTTGIFPEINPYQFLGLPTSSTSIYALTYPITYFSYYVAKEIIKKPIYIIDIFASIHIIIGYILMFIAAKKCNVKNCYSWLAGICYSLSGFSLIATRSWYYMAPIVAYAPIIVIGLQHILSKKKINFLYILTGSISVALLGYSGNIQMLVYACLFYFLGILLTLIVKQINIRKAILACYPFIFGGILTLPQLYVTYNLFKNINRIPWEIPGTILPFIKTIIIPNIILDKLNLISPEFTEHNGQLLYSGTIFVLTSIIYLLLFICFTIFLQNKKEILKHLVNNLFLVLGIIAFIMSLGANGYLWTIIHSLPVLNKFIQPVKMIIFMDLFLIIAGALILSKIRLKRNTILAVTVLILLLMCLHLKYSDSAFFKYNYVDYSDITPIISAIPDIQKHRIYSYAPARSYSKNYPLSLTLNFASYYKIPSIDSYDNRLEILLKENMDLYQVFHIYTALPFGYISILNEDTYNYLKEYGVKYIVYMDDVYSEDKKILSEGDIKKKNRIQYYINKNFKYIYKYGNNKYYEVANFKPLAYNEKIEALPIEFNNQGAVVDISSVKSPQKITVNMLKRDNYKAYVNNKELHISSDDYNRMVVTLNTNASELIIKYHSPWEKGIILMLIMLAIFSPLAYIFYKKGGKGE